MCGAARAPGFATFHMHCVCPPIHVDLTTVAAATTIIIILYLHRFFTLTIFFFQKENILFTLSCVHNVIYVFLQCAFDIASP